MNASTHSQASQVKKPKKRKRSRLVEEITNKCGITISKEEASRALSTANGDYEIALAATKRRRMPTIKCNNCANDVVTGVQCSIKECTTPDSILCVDCFVDDDGIYCSSGDCSNDFPICGNCFKLSDPDPYEKRDWFMCADEFCGKSYCGNGGCAHDGNLMVCFHCESLYCKNIYCGTLEFCSTCSNNSCRDCRTGRCTPECCRNTPVDDEESFTKQTSPSSLSSSSKSIPSSTAASSTAASSKAASKAASTPAPTSSSSSSSSVMNPIFIKIYIHMLVFTMK